MSWLCSPHVVPPLQPSFTAVLRLYQPGIVGILMQKMGSRLDAEWVPCTSWAMGDHYRRGTWTPSSSSVSWMYRCDICTDFKHLAWLSSITCRTWFRCLSLFNKACASSAPCGLFVSRFISRAAAPAASMSRGIMFVQSELPRPLSAEWNRHVLCGYRCQRLQYVLNAGFLSYYAPEHANI